MASGDFLDLQTNLAVLAGRATAAALDEDLPLCKQCINEALLEVFRPVDGRAAEWAQNRPVLYFEAPVTISIGLTLGSKVVTGYAFPSSKVGSVVQVGTNYYTYAGSSAGVYYLVETVLDATGTYSASLYHNAQPLPANTAEVLGSPERLGFGPLSAMTDLETDIRYRSRLMGDFSPERGGGYYATMFARYGGSVYPAGDAIYYRVDSDPLLDGAAVLHRLVITPMPTTACAVALRTRIFPPLLVADADRPVLIGDLVLNVLLPIARAKWAATYKKYTGDNQQALAGEADRARKILTDVRRAQKRFSGVARVGWR